MTHDPEHLFMCFFTIQILLVKRLFKYIPHLKHWVVVLLLSCQCCMFYNKSFVNDLRIFPQSRWLFFFFILMVPFEECCTFDVIYSRALCLTEITQKVPEGPVFSSASLWLMTLVHLFSFFSRQISFQIYPLSFLFFSVTLSAVRGFVRWKDVHNIIRGQ